MDSFVTRCMNSPFGRKKKPVRRKQKVKMNRLVTLDRIKGLFK